MNIVIRIMLLGLFYYRDKPVTGGLGRSSQNNRFIAVTSSYERSALASESDRVVSE